MRGISLCSGAGGLELGLGVAEPRLRTICYVEREAYAAATLVARIRDGVIDDAPIWDDVATFDPEPWRGCVDIVTSGDPCQPNSVAGYRKGQDDDRWLLDRVLEIFDQSGAHTFFRENVAGNADGQLSVLVPTLERMGCVVAAGIFSAAEVGASHRRERLFVLAKRWNGMDDTLCGRHGGAEQEIRAGRDSAVDAGGNDVAHRPIIRRDGLGEITRSEGAGAEKGRVCEPSGNSQDVAHRDGYERRPDSRQSDTGADGRHDVGRGSQDVAHRPERGQREFGRAQEPGRGGHADGGQQAVGDAEGGSGRPEPEGQGRDGTGFAGASEAMADASSNGSAERIPEQAQGQERYAEIVDNGSYRIPLFAPGPADPRWPAILEVAPHLEPAVRRVADGLAPELEFRVDRLRLTGNGVVPLAAAYAYRTLSALLDEARAGEPVLMEAAE